eukprot:gene14358-16944_t
MTRKYPFKQVPIYEGYSLPDAILPSDITQFDLTEYMARLLTERGYYFNIISQHGIISDIKKKLAYVALNFQIEMQMPKTKSYELPDGHIVFDNTK